jgi:hypothetical protein
MGDRRCATAAARMDTLSPMSIGNPTTVTIVCASMAKPPRSRALESIRLSALIELINLAGKVSAPVFLGPGIQNESASRASEMSF